MLAVLFPILFNGLFFSISPSAVHSCSPGKEVAAANIVRTVCDNPVHIAAATSPVKAKPKATAITCTKQKVTVHFTMNEHKELNLKVLVDGAEPKPDNPILQNIKLLIPQVKQYISTNKPYSISFELACNQLT